MEAGQTGAPKAMNEEFRRELAALLNRHSLENGSNTPAFLLADYLLNCLQAWNQGVRSRERWYGVELAPGRSSSLADGAADTVWPAFDVP